MKKRQRKKNARNPGYMFIFLTNKITGTKHCLQCRAEYQRSFRRMYEKASKIRQCNKDLEMSGGWSEKRW